MDYIKLSIQGLEEKTYELYKKIEQKYSYDLVIFIAKGSYLIGKKLADKKQVPLLEIQATRKGSFFKKILKPLLQVFPNKLLIKLRKIEALSSFHYRNTERKVCFERDIYKKYKNSRKILLVDDSIDSGNSITESLKAIKDYFKKSEIKVAVFNIMKKSNITPDFYLFQDTMINGPWSMDSKENKKYLISYNNWRIEYLKNNKE